MQEIEGILISKTKFKERDAICTFLLRQGTKMDVFFYGGQGGGRKKKSSLLEIGHGLNVVLQRKSLANGDMRVAKESRLFWASQQVRYHYQAYCLMCLYAEICGKVSVFQDVENFESRQSEHQGLFRVLSNALFYLDHSLQSKNLNPAAHLALFLGKLLFELGMAPNTEVCLYCENSLNDDYAPHFQLDQGGFVCSLCRPKLKEVAQGEAGKSLLNLFNFCRHQKFHDYQKIQLSGEGVNHSLLQYTCFQNNIEIKQANSFFSSFK